MGQDSRGSGIVTPSKGYAGSRRQSFPLVVLVFICIGSLAVGSIWSEGADLFGVSRPRMTKFKLLVALNSAKDESVQASVGVFEESKFAGREGLPFENIEASTLQTDEFLSNMQMLPAVSGALLPRTSSREYNRLEPDTKYVLYAPSGGFNNQLICLLNAIYVAKRAGRGVIVPPFGRHSSQFFNYYKLVDGQTIPFDQAVDLSFLEKVTGVSLVPLNVTLRQFRTDFIKVEKTSTKRVELVKIPVEEHMRYATPAKAAQVLKISVDSPKQVVFYFGAFFNRHWMEPGLRESVRLAPYMQMFAKAIADAIFHGRPYNSFHVRLGDKLEMARKLSSKSGEVYVNAARKAGAIQSTPVYVATDERKDNKYLAPLRKAYQTIVFAKDAKNVPALQPWFEDFFKRFPPSQLRSDVLGLVEMLVCVRSQKFVGTKLSTFTGTISSSRASLAVAAPDVWLEERSVSHTGSEWKRMTAAIVWNGQIQEMREDN